jgi:hypothetical protein
MDGIRVKAVPAVSKAYADVNLMALGQALGVGGGQRQPHKLEGQRFT